MNKRKCEALEARAPNLRNALINLGTDQMLFPRLARVAKRQHVGKQKTNPIAFSK